MHPSKLIIAFSCLLFACKSKMDQPKFDPDIQQVIATCIIETEGRGDTSRYFYKLSPFIPGYKTPEKIKEENDSIKFTLDTAAVYLLVNDSLGHVYHDDKAYLQTYINGLDPFSGEKVSDSLKQVESFSGVIDIADLEKAIQFPVKNKEQGINDNLRITGRFYFSKPYFNLPRTKAAIHLNFFITRHIGYGEIFLLEKIHQQWKVIKRERTWIS